MQDKAPKSSLIRLNNLANKKARRRLVGSIFLLVIALLVLFQVTSKIKPVQIKPESIEIKAMDKPNPDKSKNPIVVESVSLPTTIIESSESSTQFKPIYLNKTKQLQAVANKALASTAITSNHEKQLTSESSGANQEKQTTSAPDKMLTEKQTKPTTTKTTLTNKPNFHITPIIATEQVNKATSNPLDILDGIAPENTHAKFFVQLVASKDKNKLLTIKNRLAKEGIYTKMQSAKKDNGTVYRLRIGPFKNKIEAKAKLTEIQEKLAN